MIEIEGEDAKRFLEMLDREPTETEIETYKKAIDFYKRYNHDSFESLRKWLKKQIKECEISIRDDSRNVDYWITRRKTLEEVLRWLDDHNVCWKA